jgi:uncharacterized protein (TIGR00297 family)
MPLLPALLLGLLLSALIGYAGYRRGSLARSGVIGAMIIGTTLFGFGGVGWGVLLVAFFITSSALSHFKAQRKSALAEKFSKGRQRDLAQALANGGVGAVCALGHFFWPNLLPPALWWAAFAGAIATVNADTWATELGVLSLTPPRLITTGQVVEVGASGGLTRVGTLAAFGGAALIGAGAALLSPYPMSYPTMPFALFGLVTLAGWFGALCDSFLGATAQASYHCPKCNKDTERYPTHTCGAATTRQRGWAWLDNDGVNFVSSVVGAGVGGLGYWVMRALSGPY